MEAEFKRIVRRALDRAEVPAPRKLDPQTLAYPMTSDLTWVAVNHLRTPSRVYWRLFCLTARRLEPLHDELVERLCRHPIDWLADASRISVEVRRVGDFPAGPLQVRGAAKSAIMDAARHLGQTLQVDPDAPERLFVVEVRDDEIWFSVDLVGRSLHQRGYRRARGEAPLRENVAAQLLILSRWDPRREALVDPMAGSGTIAIEGAAMAQGRPLWCDGFKPLAARLPFMRNHQLAAPVPLFADARPPIVANEINSDTLSAIRANAERAGVADLVQVVHGDFRDLSPERLRQRTADVDEGLVIVNPPYGQRAEGKGTGDPDIADLYEDLRTWWYHLGPGWRMGILSDHPAVPRIFGRRPALEKPVSNGPLKAWFRVYTEAQD